MSGRQRPRWGWGPGQLGTHLPESVFMSVASAKDLPSARKIRGLFQAGLQTRRLRLLVWTGEKKRVPWGIRWGQDPALTTRDSWPGGGGSLAGAEAAVSILG